MVIPIRAPMVLISYNRFMTNTKYDRYKTALFQSRVLDKIVINPNTGCEEFTGALNDQGYGRVCFRREQFYVHKKIWEIKNGPVPKGLVVRHLCHNRLCCKIEHLTIGTQKDNMQDAVKADRQAKGTKIPQSKLNEEKVLEIRKLYTEGMSQKNIAKMYGVNSSNISFIVNKKTWGWL